MNTVALIGRLTKDPDTRFTAESQMCVCRFSIAVNRIGKDKGADYPNIVVFGKSAENCEKYLKKGSQVGIEGRIQTGSYEKDGRKIYTTDVIANRVEFIGGRKEEEPPAGHDIPEDFAAVTADIPF